MAQLVKLPVAKPDSLRPIRQMETTAPTSDVLDPTLMPCTHTPTHMRAHAHTHKLSAILKYICYIEHTQGTQIKFMYISYIRHPLI